MKALKYIPLTICLFSLFGCSQPEFAEVIPLEEPGPVIPESPKFSQYSQVIDQAAEEKIVDLLIVVDNSTSMSRDQSKLSREFASFVASISDADYRIGVITTDTSTRDKEDEEGFYGNLAVVASTGKRFIEKSDADPNALFAELIRRDETLDCLDAFGYTKPHCVTFDERPLYAIKLAIDKRNTVNSGFFREGADLGVVIISDEDETSFPDGTFYSAQNLLDHFEAEFGENKKITAFDIAIPVGDDTCYFSQAAETKSGTAVSFGVRIGELRELTGGFSVNICDENFSMGLNLISNYVEKNLLPLRIKVPDTILIESIKLKITKPDGSPFEADAIIEDGVLEISPLPPEGSRIELDYKFGL